MIYAWEKVGAGNREKELAMQILQNTTQAIRKDIFLDFFLLSKISVSCKKYKQWIFLLLHPYSRTEAVDANIQLGCFRRQSLKISDELNKSSVFLDSDMKIHMRPCQSQSGD